VRTTTVAAKLLVSRATVPAKTSRRNAWSASRSAGRRAMVRKRLGTKPV
jgi:hypothetical protein